MRILAATDFSTRSNRAVRQAGLLAQPASAQLHVVHVVDDDQPEQLVGMEQREAQRLLAEQIESMPELRGVEALPMVVTGDPFDGILRAAADIGADLVVMGSHRKQFLLDIFTGTTVERVIRKGTFPVLMVNNEAQRRYAKVVAPVDMSGASANALRVALSTGLITGEAIVLHAFVPLARGKMSIAGIDQAAIDEYVENERRKAKDDVVAFLTANDFSLENWSIRVEEGGPIEVISQAVADIGPDLLVMGTNGRSGFFKALLGSVTEEVLRSFNVDVLAVPPVEQ